MPMSVADPTVKFEIPVDDIITYRVECHASDACYITGGYVMHVFSAHCLRLTSRS